MTENCLFCKIIAGTIPSAKVYEDEDYYAFRDINPQAPTHVLVIPKRHISGVAAAEPADAAMLGGLLLAAKRITQQEGIADSGFRYVLNSGVDGGQTVFHLHLHILGGRPLTWPPG